MAEKLIEPLNSSSEWWKGALLLWSGVLLLCIVVTLILQIQATALRNILLGPVCVLIFILKALGWMYITYDIAVMNFWSDFKLDWPLRLENYYVRLFLATVIVAIYVNTRKRNI